MGLGIGRGYRVGNLEGKVGARGTLVQYSHLFMPTADTIANDMQYKMRYTLNANVRYLLA